MTLFSYMNSHDRYSHLELSYVFTLSLDAYEFGKNSNLRVLKFTNSL